MRDIILCITFLVLSFLIGAIPFGLIIGKIAGKDLREHGSGNIGSTNALRVLGVKGGILSAILDIIKGALIIIIAYILEQNGLFVNPLVLHGEDLLVIYGVVAVIGHEFTIYLKFKGGKGVATTAGVCIALSIIYPWFTIALVTAFISFVIVVKFTKYVSLGSTTAGLVAAILGYIIFGICYHAFVIPSFILLMVITIVLKHIPNYKRLAQGKENKIF